MPSSEMRDANEKDAPDRNAFQHAFLLYIYVIYMFYPFCISYCIGMEHEALWIYSPPSST